MGGLVQFDVLDGRWRIRWGRNPKLPLQLPPVAFLETIQSRTGRGRAGVDVAVQRFIALAHLLPLAHRESVAVAAGDQLTNSTSFEVIGENVGVIANGNTSADCAPNNPATGVPYFRLPALGWGNGWATGNVLRFNTIGSQFPVWVVRTVQQGPESVPDDHFTLLIRGDVDTP